MTLTHCCAVLRLPKQGVKKILGARAARPLFCGKFGRLRPRLSAAFFSACYTE